MTRSTIHVCRFLVPLLVSFAAAGDLTVQTSNTAENLRGISAPAASIAWASGTHGTYLRTIDGGRSWRPAQVPGAESLDFRDVEAFSANIAYLLSAGPGEQSRIYKTIDAGAHWTLQFTNHDPKGFLDCMGFWDRDHGIAVGDPVSMPGTSRLGFFLITTEDGGAHWKPIPSNALPAAIDGEGAFAASGSCLTVQGKKNVWFVTGGAAARVFRSSDRGQHWKIAETPILHGETSAGIFSIGFRDAHHGVIAGGDYKHPERSGPCLAFTNDGGATWTLSPLPSQRYASAVSFLSAKAVVTAGSTQAGYATGVETKAWSKSWDLNLNALAVTQSGQALAVGPNGAIVKLVVGK